MEKALVSLSTVYLKFLAPYPKQINIFTGKHFRFTFTRARLELPYY